MKAFLNKKKFVIGAAVTIAAGSTVGIAAIHAARSKAASASMPAALQNGNGTPYPNRVSLTTSNGYLHIDSNGIPNTPVGQFPNRNCPNAIRPQNYHYKVTLSPQPSGHGYGVINQWIFGVCLDGVPFDPGTAEFWDGNPQWKYEALGGYIAQFRGRLGIDQNNAHVQPDGAYHYHGLPFGYLTAHGYQSHMVLVGYAADGFPIYGPYCYSDPMDPKSPLKELQPSYRLKSGDRTGGPGGAYDGSFAQDYEYVPKLGDLDQFNGRFGVNHEYPNGTYYYVLTSRFPYIPRAWKGTPDSSFEKQGPPRGGPGRRGQMGRPGIGPRGMMGPGQMGPGRVRGRRQGPPESKASKS